MFKPGDFQELKVTHKSTHGWVMENEEGESIALVKDDIDPQPEIGQTLNVFVFKDSSGEWIATRMEPKIRLNRFACLKVVSATPNGAFLDWGMPKDLFVPMKQQARPMKDDEWHIVYMYLDLKSDRLAASSKLNPFFATVEPEYEFNQSVDLLVYGQTDLGYKVVVDDLYKGLIYRNEVFKPLKIGDRLTGFVKQVREDGKLDISIRKQGYGHIRSEEEAFLNRIRENNGFISLTDDSDPEEINKRLGMSKKTFKKLVGALYKKKLITLEKNGIRLNEA